MGILLELGASVNIEDGKGETPLFDKIWTRVVAVGTRVAAIRSTIKNADRKVEAIRVLMEARADPLHANRRGESAAEVADRIGVELPVERS